MQEEDPIKIDRVSGQKTESVMSFLGRRVQGDVIYLFLAGCFLGVALFVPVLLSLGPGYAVVAALAPPTAAIFFIKKFVVGKPAGYLRFWIDEMLNGPVLKRKPRAAKGRLQKFASFFGGGR